MSDLSQCHKAAVKEVMSAVGMLKDKSGSTVSDILFILDNLHGEVQRHVIQHALKSAVTNGLLNYRNRRYKLRRQRRPVSTIARRRKSTMRRAKVTKVVCDGMCSKCDVPVRNFECRAKQRRVKSHRPKSNSYSFKEVRSLLSCDCCCSASSLSTELSYEPKKTRRVVKNHVRRRYPAPKKILKVEKKDSQEENCGQITNEVDAKTSSGGANELLQNSSKEKLKEETIAKDEKASKNEGKCSKSTSSAKSSSSKKAKNKGVDNHSTSDKTDDNKTTSKDEEDVNAISIAPCSAVSSKRIKRDEKVKNENLENENVLEETGCLTRSRSKRRRSKSSKSSKSNHKKSKPNSNKSLKEEKKENNKDRSSSSKNYEHMYSSLSPSGK